MEFYLKLEGIPKEDRAGFNSQRDGILPLKAILTILQITFQFPTGWNSTENLQNMIASAMVSIPNGMEFYAFGYTDQVFAAKSFNSQRDGILHKGIFASIKKALFQFPTGWNSTQLIKQRASRFVVSIPNGMEFYRHVEVRYFSRALRFNSQRDGILPPVSALRVISNFGFNSQRDGILPKVSKKRWKTARVSIPNGMEFYAWVDLSPPQSKSFNSQRDGILRSSRHSTFRNTKFQFPTGWNSTLEWICRRRKAKVSIPNGMEFYAPVVIALFAIPSFNSQRDGILLRYLACACYFAEFQFPTGWNSTPPIHQRLWHF